MSKIMSKLEEVIQFYIMYAGLFWEESLGIELLDILAVIQCKYLGKDYLIGM